ncbi:MULTISPECIES: hypothetical protein [Acinetobacter]|uniref:hypothetical protein n=1 Tax=Acinetobacter TaxID=469 RepID=UPI001436AC89|nr:MULTISPECIES: hypothetical protein [Acinetobacter]MCA4814921.1 hypothetical protein [Acinetobacter towneri]QIV91805.1 hypothetical protein GVU25_02870 [Acinetobacter towneri]
MQTLKQQQGIATVLLVVLVGITVMVTTASLSRTVTAKKEASVAAHAQTNAQIMAWAGASAFHDYILQQGKNGIADILTLNGQSIVLKANTTQEITASNILVIGCAANGDICKISADISADNEASQAATTLNVVYEFEVKDGTITSSSKSAKMVLGGNTKIASTIEANHPDTELELNVDGDLWLQTGATLKNISKLTINSTGDVVINCSTINLGANLLNGICGGVDIDVNAAGRIEITDTGSGSFGSLNAKGPVTVYGLDVKNIRSLDRVCVGAVYSPLTKTCTAGLPANAENITAKGNVDLFSGSRSENIVSNSDVTIHTGSKAGNIKARNITVTGAGARAKNLTATGDVKLWLGGQVDDILAKGAVEIHTGSEAKNIKAGGRVLITGAGARANNVETASAFEAWIAGRRADDVYANEIMLAAGVRIGNAYSASKIVNEINTKDFVNNRATSVNRNSSVATSKIKALKEQLASIAVPFVNTSSIETYIDEKNSFEKTRVDVKQYKSEANYIFTMANLKRSEKLLTIRVFLNHLKNATSGEEYIYENNTQYRIKDGVKTQVSDGKGFYLGRYSIDGKNEIYIDAICEEVEQRTLFKQVYKNVCISEIVGYFPQVGVTNKITGDMWEPIGHDSVSNVWYVRAFFDDSDISNPMLTPGILYFEGSLAIHGKAGLTNPKNNTFTNSFLAEGNINITTAAPTIYSPYNILREKPNAEIICNRKITPSVTTAPSTVSNTYLIPTNLCKSNTEFSYSMNNDENGNPLMVNIDGQDTTKLDLGYVALMTNKKVNFIGICPHIYGDIFSKYEFNSSLCGKIEGNISTQMAQPSFLDPYANDFEVGLKVILPEDEFTNIKGSTSTTETTGLTMDKDTFALKWSRYL